MRNSASENFFVLLREMRGLCDYLKQNSWRWDGAQPLNHLPDDIVHVSGFDGEDNGVLMWIYTWWSRICL
jgi:hypothetical protein